MRRDIFTEEHELFRSQFRRFAEKEIAPEDRGLERARHERPRDLAPRRRGRASSARARPRSTAAPARDFLYDAIVIEELARVRAHGMMISLHSDICLPYLSTSGPRSRSGASCRARSRGDVLLGIAMTEPGTGSDLAERPDHGASATATTTC